MAKLRDPRVQASEEEMAHSLEGNWREDVLFELQPVMEAYDFQQKQMAACDVQLQKYMAALPSRGVPGKQPAAVEPARSGRAKKRGKPRRSGDRRINPTSI